MTELNSTKPTLSLKSPADLLAYLPYHLGFQPTESLVVVALNGERTHLGMTMRMDLPAVDDGRLNPRHLNLIAETAIPHLLRDQASRVLLVCYTDQDAAPYLTLVNHLETALWEAGIDLVDAFTVGRDHWRSLLCLGQDCCPAEGFPVSELAGAPIVAESVFRGLAVQPSREGRLANVQCTDAALAKRLNRVTRRLPILSTQSEEMLGVWHTWRALIDSAMAHQDGAPEVSETDAARVLHGIRNLYLRDALLMDLVVGDTNADFINDYLHRRVELTDEVLCECFAGDVQPDTERAQAGMMVLRSLARQTLGRAKADALAMLAWGSWWTGEVSLARDLAELALEHNDAQSMADLVFEMAAAGMPPGWVARRREQAS